eukprot:Rhum_TRINITY_DN14531_c12_g2::Rhum_TRINITY_DN14531_c12_g2_i1::g.97788::m.97788
MRRRQAALSSMRRARSEAAASARRRVVSQSKMYAHSVCSPSPSSSPSLLESLSELHEDLASDDGERLAMSLSSAAATAAGAGTGAGAGASPTSPLLSSGESSRTIVACRVGTDSASTADAAGAAVTGMLGGCGAAHAVFVFVAVAVVAGAGCVLMFENPNPPLLTLSPEELAARPHDPVDPIVAVVVAAVVAVVDVSGAAGVACTTSSSASSTSTSTRVFGRHCAFNNPFALVPPGATACPATLTSRMPVTMPARAPALPCNTVVTTPDPKTRPGPFSFSPISTTIVFVGLLAAASTDAACVLAPAVLGNANDMVCGNGTRQRRAASPSPMKYRYC